MELTRVTEAHARRQKLLAQRTATRLAELWGQVSSAHLAASWRGLLPEAYAALATSQATAAAGAGLYVEDALEAQKFFVEAEGRVSAAAFAGVASDGRDLVDLLYQPVIQTLTALGQGETLQRSRAVGLLHLDVITRTQVADAGRVAESVAIAARPAVSGYVRMLNLPSCSRCIILAGKWYRWNSGFKRHPRCDCRHIPARENDSESLTTNPGKLFRSMGSAEQDRVFTKAGAQALRDGADMNQVVNARRGALGLSPAGARLTKDEISKLVGGQARGSLKKVDVSGQQVNVTTEGAKSRGPQLRTAKTARLMPESIYQAAGNNRQEAIRLLKRFGFIV